MIHLTLKSANVKFSFMNTRKYTLVIRLACLALAACDAYVLTQFASVAVTFLVWLLGSFALVVAIAPVKSRFTE